MIAARLCCGRNGRVASWKRLANMPTCLIGMEACVGARHLSRKLKALGHDARTSPASAARHGRGKWPARCRGQSTRARVTWRARSQSLGKAECPDGCARRSRCCSRTLKRILKLDRLRLRGPTGARDDLLLAATGAAEASAQNGRELWWLGSASDAGSSSKCLVLL